ncbi:MAG: DUF2304 family protein [Myxococcales bacterium]|nr:DUF2304 family protein [Myxococcales bacterium]
MTLASAALLVVVWGLFVFDAVTLRGPARRMLALEACFFLAGSVLIASPDSVTSLANRVGIGRGADFVSYMAAIWLARESLVNRRRRLELDDRLTETVRAVALLQAKEVVGTPQRGQSSGESASTTT